MVKKNPYEMEIAQIKEEYLKEKKPKAQLVRLLKTRTNEMQGKYNHLVDTNVKILGEDYFARKLQQGFECPIEIYSTAHSRSTKIIYKLIDEYLKKRDAHLAEGVQLREGGSREEDDSSAGLVT